MANQANKSPFGVGHDGRPKGVPNKPGMSGPSREAPAFQGHEVPGNIARDGAPKFHHDVPVHGGMNAKSRRTGVHFDGVGGDGISAFDANPGTNPLGGAPRGKVLMPVQPVPGQRERSKDAPHGGAPGENHARGKPNIADMQALGRAVLTEAFANSQSDNAYAHNYPGGMLPESTNEK